MDHQDFDYTPEGLREAWECRVEQNNRSTRACAEISHPDGADLDEPDGLTDAERETLHDYDEADWRALHADEIAEDAYWDARISEDRGK